MPFRTQPDKGKQIIHTYTPKKVHSPWHLDSSRWILGTSLQRQSRVLIFGMSLWISHLYIFISAVDCRERRCRNMGCCAFNKRRIGRKMNVSVWGDSDLMKMIQSFSQLHVLRIPSHAYQTFIFSLIQCHNWEVSALNVILNRCKIVQLAFPQFIFFIICTHFTFCWNDFKNL